MIELALIACFLIAFSIGSNDSSNAFGISIGCGVLSFKRATFLILFFVLAGAIIQGREVMETTGKLVQLNANALALSLVVSAALVILSNWRKLPVSTHQVIVGSLVGSGFAFNLAVDTDSLMNIVISWIVSPFGAFLLAIFVFLIIERVVLRYSFIKIERSLRTLLLISGILIAYNTGANELATALGPIVYYDLLGQTLASTIGAILIWIGAVLLSFRVIETVGKGITALDPQSGFAAQFGAGLTVWVFTSLGMPISTTYCIIGGISGVGALKGLRTVKLDLIKRIVINWFMVPILAAVICFGAAKLMFS